MRRLPLRSTAVLLGCAALLFGPLSVPASAAVVEIDVLAINDFHGRLELSPPSAQVRCPWPTPVLDG